MFGDMSDPWRRSPLDGLKVTPSRVNQACESEPTDADPLAKDPEFYCALQRIAQYAAADVVVGSGHEGLFASVYQGALEQLRHDMAALSVANPTTLNKIGTAT